MADAESILGTSGKTQLPFEYQLEEQQIARKRAMAQALLQRGMTPQAPPQMFGRYAAHQGKLPAVANALAAFMGARGLGAAEEDSTALAGKVGVSQAEQQKQAVAQAVAASRSKRAVETAKLIGGDRGASWLQADNPDNPIPATPNPQIEYATGPDGSQIAYSKDPDTGKIEFKFAPKPTTITNDVKLGNSINEDAAKYFNYGGKGYELGQSARTGLQNTQELLNTLDQNPSMGAGAEGFQFARKWAETLGAPVSPTTTPTELAKMQLGQKTLDRLGGLGAQVSDSDRKFMLETQGSLGNDPEAVRRMLLVEAKYLMRIQNDINAKAGKVSENLPASTALPRHDFNFNLSKRNADDMERLFQNQGFGPAPGVVLPGDRPPPAGRLKRVP